MQTYLIKPSSGNCNMMCDYCFYCDEIAKRDIQSYGMMTEETIEKIIKKVLANARDSICFAFQGGEPTLRGLEFFEKVLNFEQSYNRNQVQIINTLQTNGLLIDEAWCDFLSKNKFLVGISVDGTQQIHDLYRHDKNGNPTNNKVVKAIKTMDAYSVEYNILTVVTQQVAKNIKSIYRYYKENGWKYQQYITCLDQLGERWGEATYSLTPEIYGKFMVELFDLWYKDWQKGKNPYIRQFENYIGIILGRQAESCEQRGTCSVQCVIEADGSVYPCDFYVLDQYKLGDFNNNRIRDFYDNDLAKQFVAESRKISSTCLNCEFYNLCRCGCMRSRIKNYVTNTYCNYFCESYKLFFTKCYDRLLEIAKFVRYKQLSLYRR